MRMCLKDRVDDALIIDEDFNFCELWFKEDDHAQVKVREVRGVGGSAFVSYGAFSTAVLASVEIILIQNDKTDGIPSTAADLYGRIVARYGNTYGTKYPGVLLFNKPPNQSIGAVSNGPIELSRNMVVVPAYSFLRIDVDLSDFHTNKPAVNGKAEFLTSHFPGPWQDEIETEDFIIKVIVQWFHPYVVENQVEKLSKHSTLSLNREPSLRKHCALGISLTEVFTVMIGHDSNSVLNICGTVRIRDGTLIQHPVFNRNKFNPLTLSSNSKPIPIEGPSVCVKGPEGLVMAINLWDVQGRALIKGGVLWNPSSMKWPISWYDRPLCSVFRGVHGYAAVFYTIFSEAVQALVKVSFMSKGSVDTSHHVYGTIVAKYLSEYYSTEFETEYERAYYRNVLFDKPQVNTLELKSGCTIPLLKSVVAVPCDDSLTVKVDLYASSLLDESPREHLKGVGVFDINPTALIPQVIEGKDYRIELSVEWSEFY